MKLFLLIGVAIILAVMAIVVTVSNPQAVELNLLFATVAAPLGKSLMISFLIGLFSGGIIFTLPALKQYRSVKQHKKKLGEAKAELDNLRTSPVKE